MQFSGSVARKYDEYFGPMFFEPYAAEVGALFDSTRVKGALEVACGTGRVTRHLRKALNAHSELIASDISADMLAIAKEKVKGPGIEWRIVDAEHLPFDDSTFDLVVCYFGYMIVPDRAKAFLEAQRVLRKGGMLLMATWDKLEHNEASFTLQKIVSEYLLDDLLEPYRLPFSMYEKAAITEMLSIAGFSKVVLQRSQKRAEAESASKAADVLTTVGPLYYEIARQNPSWVKEIASRVEQELGSRYGTVPMSAPMSAITTQAWK